jgi:indolepyruvate decarboxylase
VGDILFASADMAVDQLLAPSYYASMGFSVPGALGASLARNGRRVLALAGDGAFQMTGNELGTWVRHGVNPVLVVGDNSGFESMRQIDRASGMYDVPKWDFVAFCESQGVDAVRVETLPDLWRELVAAWERARASVIVADLAPGTSSPALRRVGQEIRSRLSR